MLVRPEIERTDRDRQTFHFHRHFAIGLELLVFRRQDAAAQEQELAAKQADPCGGVLFRLGHVLGQLDVGVQLDTRAVERRGARRLEPLELLFLELPLLLPQPELRQHRLVRIDDYYAAVAVHDQQLAFADQCTRVMKRNDRRNVQAARKNRGVRGGSAQVGDEAAEAMLLEHDYVGGGKGLQG